MNIEAVVFFFGIITGIMVGFIISVVIDPFTNFESKVEERGFIVYRDEVYIVKKVPHDRFVQGNHTIDSNR